MKPKKLYSIILLTAIFIGGCISEFEEFKENKTNFVKDDMSAKFFFTNTQTRLWVPPVWDFFYTQYNWARIMAGYVGAGHKQHWENGDILFNTEDPWQSLYVWDVYSNYFSNIDLFIKAVEPGGEFENGLMYAVGQIVKGSYFAIYTDVFGEIPFSEVGQEGVLLPKFDEQKDIYKGIIDLLDEAIAAIGSETVTGLGVNDLGINDIIFKGDLQKWKAYANCLKLRLALRAKGAPGADFADAAITEALNGPFITEDVQIVKDLSVNWKISATGSDFINQYKNAARLKVSSYMVNFLHDNNDPRLSAYAMPIGGGAITFDIPANNQAGATKIVNFLIDNLKRAGLTDEQIGRVDQSDKVTINLLENAYYVGIPLRFHDNVKAFADFNLFSNLAGLIEGKYTLGKEIPQVIFPVAEMYLLRAEAAVLGFGGDANALYKQGIEASFTQWEVSDNGYLGSEMATLAGTQEEMLEKIGMQLWASLYLVDFQGWSVARDFNLPEIKTELTDGDLYSLNIELGGRFPERAKYGTKAYSLNPDNVNIANARQGPDVMSTKLWFAKGSK